MIAVALTIMLLLGLIEGIGMVIGLGISDLIDGLLPDFDVDADLDIDADLGWDRDLHEDPLRVALHQRAQAQGAAIEPQRYRDLLAPGLRVASHVAQLSGLAQSKGEGALQIDDLETVLAADLDVAARFIVE